MQGWSAIWIYVGLPHPPPWPFHELEDLDSQSSAIQPFNHGLKMTRAMIKGLKHGWTRSISLKNDSERV